jgi:hypothetical protein
MVSHRFGRFVPIAALLFGAIIGLRSTATGQDNFSIRVSSDTGVPELVFYHGMVLDENLQQIPPTLDNVARVIRRYTEGLAARSSDAAKVRFVDLLRSAPTPLEMDKTDELLQSVVLARWLLKNGDRAQEQSLAPILGALETWATIPTREGINTQLRNNSRLAPMLAAMELNVADEAPAAETTDYIETCRREQVPIPPDWGDKRWKFHYPLDPSYSFVADADSIAQVWTYTDPAVPGLCVGLPRIDRFAEDEQIGLFGIICQSQTTGKACFWDNVDRETGDRLTPEQSKSMKIAKIQDGSLIKENCTNCHRGENVFNIHPRTALDLSGLFATSPDVEWYAPISDQTNWGNPGPIAGLKFCNRCHKLPELGDNNNTTSGTGIVSAYCRILRQVVDKTMPPDSVPIGWLNPTPHDANPSDDQKAIDDINLLRTKCDQLMAVP